MKNPLPSAWKRFGHSSGAVVVPAALVDEVVAASVEQEQLEGWIMNEVNNGASLPGLYPPNEANKARYAEWAKKKGGSQG